MRQKEKTFAKKVYVTALVNLATTTCILLIHFLLVVFEVGKSSLYLMSLVTLLTLGTFVFLYRDLHHFPSRKETRVFVTTLAVVTLVLIILGLTAVWFTDERAGISVYLAMVSVPAWFAVGVTAFDQIHREQAVSKVQYGCLRAKEGSYTAYVFYQWLMYLVLPFVIFCVFMKYTALGYILVVLYSIGGVLFNSIEYRNRIKYKISIFWKRSIAKK